MKTNTRSLIGLLLITTNLLPTITFAKGAQTLLYPTRIILDKNESATTVLLKNTGVSTGDYKIELVDMKMPEEGAIVQLNEGEKTDFSAKNFLRISPKSVTLEASNEQNIRLMVRKPKGLADGEYRTHLKVTMSENTENEKDEIVKELAVKAVPLVSMVIPIIIRYGNLDYKVKILDAKYRTEIQEHGAKSNFIDLTFKREGNRSSMGDLTINYINKNGEKVLLKQLNGIPIYRPTETRKLNLQFDMPKEAKINGGKLNVIYRAQEKEGGHVIAEGDFPI